MARISPLKSDIESKRPIGVHENFATELVRRKVDIIVVAGGNEVVRAAMNATKTIPIVLMGQGPIRS